MSPIARIHGRNGVIYLGLASSAATAEPLQGYAKWSIKFSTDKAEVTAFGDSNKQYVSGLPDASGDFSGFYDDATVQTYTAALDGQKRAFYLYPSNLKLTQYFYGYILPDIAIDGDVAGAVAVSTSWNAAGAITKQG